jgi:hypothetical protein
MKRGKTMGIFFLAGLILFALVVGRSVIAQDWRTASSDPVGLAPVPATTPEAVVQVYGARTWGWRGNFGVHTWIAVKPANAEAYTVYEVIGWRLRWADSVVAIHGRAADARWYGNAPGTLCRPARRRRPEKADSAHRRGGAFLSLRQRVPRLARPNSNTFTA